MWGIKLLIHTELQDLFIYSLIFFQDLSGMSDSCDKITNIKESVIKEGEQSALVGELFFTIFFCFLLYVFFPPLQI